MGLGWHTGWWWLCQVSNWSD